jgi:undecaprenyl-diphosphatase
LIELIEYLEEIDRNLFLLLNPLGHPWLDQTMWMISKTFTWLPVYIFMLWALWTKTGAKKTLFALLAFAMLVTLCDQTSVHLFKEIFQRYRPSHNLEIKDQIKFVLDQNGNPYKGGKFGFVSSHAANMFGVVTLFFLMMRPLKWYYSLPLFLWAGLIAYSRIYLGVHYPADIFVGALLGTTIAISVYSLFRFIVPDKTPVA